MAEKKEQRDTEIIDLREVARALWQRKRLFATTLACAFVLSCIWIFPQPRYYQAEVTLAPEMENIAGGGGGLMDIAASLGFNLESGSVSDAIYPRLYPDLTQSSNFIVGLFDVEVATEDGDYRGDYYTYLSKHQKRSPWSYPMIWARKAVGSLLPAGEKGAGTGGSRHADPFCLTEEQDRVVQMIRNAVVCDVDLKTSVITITVEDQDRKICAAMADSVRVKLQDYITAYRTKKAVNDLDYYRDLVTLARSDYDSAVSRYSAYSDTHSNPAMQTFISHNDKLEKDVDLKYQTYASVVARQQSAEAKVLERTPAFTVLQVASMPQRPVRPKRVVFVLGMMFLTFLGTSLYIFKDSIINQIMGKGQKD